jgi:two-component sensor histidine kinase
MREEPPTSATAAPDTVEGLRAALAAEQARTREVDHRAKNNLQLVASLLLLSSRRCTQDETRKTLKAMQQRVSALAAVHRNLLDSERPDGFDLTRLVREHVTALARSHGGAEVRLELDPVAAPPAAAAALALIVNELTLNALEHGGAAGAPPAVTVRLLKEGEGFALEVQDAGAGPAAVKDGGFGLHVVRLLSQQLSAGFELADGRPGLKAVVRT